MFQFTFYMFQFEFVRTFFMIKFCGHTFVTPNYYIKRIQHDALIIIISSCIFYGMISSFSTIITSCGKINMK